MTTQTIENFFTGKTLVIPSYQRDYAWRERNVDDLFDDIEEALEISGGHYLGTFILSQQHKDAPVYVVDGQQRLTTLTMLIDALIDAVDDENLKMHYRNQFIRNPVSGEKFQVLGSNEKFFRDLLDKRNPTSDSDGQERMLNAYRWIQQRVSALIQRGGHELIKQWLRCISQMEVLQFIEPNEGKAIRMFQSVNDRGVPLAKMDIVKSLLVYYSNRYLQGELDTFISEKFGHAFRSFSRIKKMASEPGYKIKQIDRSAFVEDDIFRYHYLAFNANLGDYTATSETVLEIFLKPRLKELRGDAQQLSEFIKNYTADLTAFFASLEALVESTRNDKKSYLLLVIQDLSATLYPLLIRLHLLGWLHQICENDPRTLMDIIEMTDLRVFKLHGNNPRADIFRITRTLHSANWVCSELKNFCDWGMPNARMASLLMDDDIYRNPALPRMLLQVESRARTQVGEPELSLEELVALNRNGLTIEHILPQDPNNRFDTSAYGFLTNEEYMQYVHRLGNLVLLEGSINSACQNHTVESKVLHPNLYCSSSLSSVRAIAAICADNSQFRKNRLIERSRSLSRLMAESWPIRY